MKEGWNQFAKLSRVAFTPRENFTRERARIVMPRSSEPKFVAAMLAEKCPHCAPELSSCEGEPLRVGNGHEVKERLQPLGAEVAARWRHSPP
jgi:hypothetical protein